jgi:hypothetical protein
LEIDPVASPSSEAGLVSVVVTWRHLTLFVFGH